ncbi:tape measure protein [Bradyrhizobium sp. 179]|uniref:tape measure protein n=1 Tax=Bradyrhizobium sp. 179 TaxID=2782648 RepID=UPI001FFA6FEE|nr:tape measure protein [Bradyrhizobium sp. 179]MCK1543427.1 tape measure protein [Bradyrhizobium sp. 179]
MPIRVELELEDGSFTSRMIHAGETVEQFRKNVGQGVVSIERLNDKATTFSGTLRDVAITAGLATMAIGALHNVSDGWIGSIVKINAEMERLKFLLAGMNKSADPVKEAAQQVAYLRDFAKDAPFSLKALSDSFVKLKSTGIDPMAGALKGLTDGIAAFGGNDEVLHRASIAIQQMAGKGVIQMEELRQQLGEAMPRAVELMARSMGVSTAELIQIVGKGTLEAKTSLAAFTMELDRTFGGAAANQMNTFNGLVSRTTTLFQNLALQAGEAGFFEAIKDKLRQFNEALSSQKFEQFAGAVGRWATSVVNFAASGVSWMIQFKDEIINVGLALGTAFGAAKIAQIIQGFGAMTLQMRAGISLIRNEWALMTAASGKAFAGLGTAFAFGAQAGTLTNMAGIWATLTQTISGTGTAITKLLPVLGACFAFVAEFALPLTAMGAALYFVYEAFTKESRAAEEAYDTMVKFGAQTQEQIKLADQHVKSLEARADALRAVAKAQSEGAFGAGGEGLGRVTDKDAGDARKDANDARQKLIDEEVKLEKTRAEKFAQEQMRALQEQQSRRKLGYDKESIAAAEAHEKEMQSLKTANKDTSAEKERYLTETRERQLAQYKLEQQDAEDHLRSVQLLASLGDKNAIAGLEKTTQEVTAIIADRQKKVTELQDMAKGPQEIRKDTDIAKLIEKAQSKLDSSKGDLAAQKAELQGLSGEYARLAYMIENAAAKSNAMYVLNNPVVQKLIEDLKATQVEADKVKEALDGLKALDSDLASANANARQEYLKQINDGKSSVFDSIAAKADAGLYSGKSAIARLLGGIKTAAEEAGKAQDGAFGQGMVDKTMTFAGALEKVQGIWKGIRDYAAGTTNSPAPSAPGGSSVTGSYASKVIQAESSGDPNAKSTRSSAAGLGGFTEGTWMDFIKENRPDLLDLGPEMLQRLRKDPGMVSQAIDWYGNKNAGVLSRNGFQANDANTYLAHFLGAGGALSVLRADPSTPLDQIKALEAARKSNPEVFSRAGTAGGLQAWAEARMGDGVTTTRAADTSSYARARAAATSPEQLAQMAETKAIEDLAKSLKGMNDLKKFGQDMKEAVAAAKENEDGNSKYRNALTKMIRSGKALPDNRDPSSPEYAAMFSQADQSDAALREAAETKKRNERLKQIREGLPTDSDVMDEKTAEALKRLQDKSKFKLSDGYYAEEKKTAKNIGLFMSDSEANPNNKAQNDQYIAQLQQELEKRKNLEVTNTLNTETQKYEAIKRSLMTTDQARQDAYQAELKRLDDLLAKDTSTGEERAAKEEEVARRKALLARQQFDLTPIGGMLKQWSDYGHNLEQAATGWMNGFNDKLADMVMKGRVNFRSLAQSIEKDIITMSLKAAESKLFSGLLGLGGFSGGGVPGTMEIGGQSFVAYHHTGGVAGSAMPNRRVNMNLFAGAQRFHTGTGGMTLGGDEIPIIAKRGEQVDWPENLARQYGGKGGGTFAMGDINIHGASNGSPSQNKDLAEQIAGQVRAAASEMMGRELRTQMRPGGTIRAMTGR